MPSTPLHSPLSLHVPGKPLYSGPNSASDLKRSNAVAGYPAPNASDSMKVSTASGQMYLPLSAMASTEPLPMPYATRFPATRKCNDVFFALLFFTQLMAVIGLAIWALPVLDLSSSNGSENANGGEASVSIGAREVITLFITGIGAMLIAFCYVLLLRKKPSAMIKVTYWGSILMYLISGILSIVNSVYFGGIISLLIGLFFAFAWFIYRERIPFTAVLLKEVSNTTLKYPGTIVCSLISIFFGLAYTGLLAFTTMAIYVRFLISNPPTDDNNVDLFTLSPSIIVILAFFSISVFWTTNVIKNVVHVTVSGVFASHYFLQGTPQGMPTWPTLRSLKRALTTSFGSVCFGSLLVALIQSLRSLVRGALQSTENKTGLWSFLASCFDFLTGYLDILARLFNMYAFTQVAMYGKPYSRAAKDTWRLIKDRGMDIAINYQLTGTIIGFGSFFIGGLTGLLAFVTYFLYPPHIVTQENASLFLKVMIGATSIGTVVFFYFGEIIRSGSATTFVALAEDPAVLKASKPELWEEIRKTNPEAAFVSMYD